MTEENKDIKTLSALLDHWVEHNESHQKGFAEWSAKAKENDKIETAKYIDEAIQIMDKANEALRKAKETI